MSSREQFMQGGPLRLTLHRTLRVRHERHARAARRRFDVACDMDAARGRAVAVEVEVDVVVVVVGSRGVVDMALEDLELLCLLLELYRMQVLAESCSSAR